MEKRFCLECGEELKGRVDKKFCSDLCRNAYNNKQNSDSTNFVRNVNNQLRRNRRALEECLVGEKTTVSRQKLIDKGFSFAYFTNQVITKNNHTYFFCYEFGYLPLENDLVLIVKEKRRINSEENPLTYLPHKLEFRHQKLFKFCFSKML